MICKRSINETQNKNNMPTQGDGSIVLTSLGSSSYTYDAFGNETEDNTTDENPFRYCGEYYDAESGLIYLRNRYYDPSVGRFISEDPAKDGSNWYVYCNNNPVMFVDPLGLKFSVLKDDYDQFEKVCSALYGDNVIIDKKLEDDAYIIDSISIDGEAVSITGTSLFSVLASDELYIYRIIFGENSKSAGSDRDGKNTNSFHAVIGTKDINTLEIASRLSHELTHLYTDRYGYNEEVKQNIYSTDSNYFVDKGKIEKGYREATAITVEEQVRRELRKTYGATSVGMREDSGMIDIADDSAGVIGFGFWPWMPAQVKNSSYYGKYYFGEMSRKKSLGIVIDIWDRANTR